jgi:hypothetical protein
VRSGRDTADAEGRPPVSAAAQLALISCGDGAPETGWFRDDDDDELLLADLRGLLEDLDPLPPSVIARARATFAPPPEA